MKPRNKTMLLAAAVGTLLLSNASQAALTITFSQVGANVVASSSGTFDVAGLSGLGVGTSLPENTALMFAYGIYSRIASVPTTTFLGLVSVAFLSLPTTNIPAVVPPPMGDHFRLFSGVVEFAQATLVTGTTYTPVFTSTFPGQTLFGMGLTSLLTGGPVVAATNPSNNDTIRYSLALATIPEPSRSLLVGLVALGACLARRRKVVV